MLSREDIEVRKREIVAARGSFVQQMQTIQARIANIDGALELIVLFEKDLAAKAAAEQAEADAILAEGNAAYEAGLVPANDADAPDAEAA